MRELLEPIVGIASLIVGVAIVAVLVSQRSNTTGVLQAAGSAFSNALGVATAPVTGTRTNLNLSYPTSPLGGSFGGFSMNQIGMNFLN